MFCDESVFYFGPQNYKNVLSDALDSTESLSVFYCVNLKKKQIVIYFPKNNYIGFFFVISTSRGLQNITDDQIA